MIPDFLVAEISKRSGTYVSGAYQNKESKLTFECRDVLPSGELCNSLFERSWASFRRGDGLTCQRCSNRRLNAAKAQAAAPGDFHEEARRRGSEFLGGIFTDQYSPMSFRCLDIGPDGVVCGEVFTRSWKVVQRQATLVCKACAWRKGADKQTFSEAFVAEYLADVGFELLEPYTNSQTSVRLRCLSREGCSGGVEFRNSINNLRNKGVRTCPPCSRRRVGDNLMLTLEEVKSAFRERGAEPLFTEYLGNDVPLLFRCSHPGCQNTHTVRYADVTRKEPDGGLRRAAKLLCPPHSDAALPRGPNHHNWREDLTDEDRAANFARGPEFDKWQKAVKRRDNWICQLSGRDGDMQSHHIKWWTRHPESRFDLGNGVCVSTPIHKQFHKIYRSDTPDEVAAWHEFCARYRAGDLPNAKVD